MAIACLQGRLQRPLQATRNALFDDEAIDDHGQMLGAGDVRGRDVFQQQVLAVEPHVAVASAINGGEYLLGRLVLPRPARRENHQARTLRHTRSRFVCFLKAMRLHLPAAVEAAGLPDAGKEQAQQVVQARQSRHRSPRTLVAGPSGQREGGS